MAGGNSSISSIANSFTIRGKRRDFGELAIGYGLILLVIWTPRPWQMALWCVAAAFLSAVIFLTFDGLESMGLRAANLKQAFFVIGVVLVVAAVAVAVSARMHTLHLPGGPLSLIKRYWGYALWAAVQQLLIQCFLLSRLLRLLQNKTLAVVAAAVMFAFTHLPSPILTPITLVGGIASCMFFLRYRNLYPLALAHAILGISVAVTIPGPVDHNMRVGLSYLNYSPNRTPSSQP